MKGTVYSGIVYYPSHPLADMHGLLRACVRTRIADQVRTLLARNGITTYGNPWLSHYWCESKSVAEEHATEKHYGEILVCSLIQSYLSPDVYHPIKGA